MESDRLSKTAAYIAVKFYGLTLEQAYRDLFNEETVLFYDRLVASLPGSLNKFHSLLRKKWIRKLCISLDEWLLPGDLMHILSRKLYIDNMVSELVGKGYNQLVVLGAGFDHLATKYSSQNISCFEIDTPEMAHSKQQFISKYNYNNSNLTVHPFHLSLDSVPKTLSKLKKIIPERKTVIVAEGFFDYLSYSEANNVLAGITSFWEEDVMLISTVFSLEELSRFHAFTFKAGVRMVGEQLKLHLNLNEFRRLLDNKRFVIQEYLTANSMKQNMVRSENIKLSFLPGFYLVRAEFQ